MVTKKLRRLVRFVCICFVVMGLSLGYVVDDAVAEGNYIGCCGLNNPLVHINDYCTLSNEGLEDFRTEANGTRQFYTVDFLTSTNEVSRSYEGSEDPAKPFMYWFPTYGEAFTKVQKTKDDSGFLRVIECRGSFREAACKC